MVLLEAMEREKSNPKSGFYGTRVNLTADVNSILVEYLRPRLTVEALSPPPPPKPVKPIRPPAPPALGPVRSFPHGPNGEPLERQGKAFGVGQGHHSWCPAMNNRYPQMNEPWCYCSDVKDPSDEEVKP